MAPLRTIGELSLSQNEQLTLEEAKRRLTSEFPIEELIVFGSVARGEATEESDLDLLALARRPMTHLDDHAVSDAIFKINLSFGTNISVLVVDRVTWETGLWSVLPLHQDVIRDGVPL